MENDERELEEKRKEEIREKILEFLTRHKTLLYLLLIIAFVYVNIKHFIRRVLVYLLPFFTKSLSKSRELDKKDLEELKFSYGATMAVALGTLLAIVGSGTETLDFPLYASIILLALSIPFLLISFLFVIAVNPRASVPKYPPILGYLQNIGQYATFLALLFIFFHYSSVAGLVFLLAILLAGIMFLVGVVYYMFTDEEFQKFIIDKTAPEKRENMKKVIQEAYETWPKIIEQINKYKTKKE